MRTTSSTASSEKITRENQKPSMPESLTAALPVATPWTAICTDEYMSLPW